MCVCLIFHIYIYTQTQSYLQIYTYIIYACVVPKIFAHDMRFHFAPILFRVLRTVVSCCPCFVLSKTY